MELYEILVKENDIILIALKSISNKDFAISNIENYILKKKFSGTLILDYLIFCSSLDSTDRFIVFKVYEGVIKYEDKHYFNNRLSKFKEIANRYYSTAPYDLLKFSLLKKSEKSKLLDLYK